MAQTDSPIWLYSDQQPPNLRDRVAAGAHWTQSRALTGTHDWIELSVEFETRSFYRLLVREQQGAARSWFDNVIVEPMPAERPDLRPAGDRPPERVEGLIGDEGPVGP